MDAGKLKRKADAVRSVSLMITGHTKDPITKEKLQAMLKGVNFEEILIQICPDFFEWMETLPTDPVPGLADECWNWIRHWGNGGGDYSTETMIQAAINELKSDEPKALANTIYSSVSDYCKTPFEASVLTMNIMDECLTDCLVTS